MKQRHAYIVNIFVIIHGHVVSDEGEGGVVQGGGGVGHGQVTTYSRQTLKIITRFYQFYTTLTAQTADMESFNNFVCLP